MTNTFLFTTAAWQKAELFFEGLKRKSQKVKRQQDIFKKLKHNHHNKLMLVQPGLKFKVSWTNEEDYNAQAILVRGINLL